MLNRYLRGRARCALYIFATAAAIKRLFCTTKVTELNDL
jgi:hypothetical protein